MKWNNQLIEQLQWSNTIINRAGKERVAKEVADIAKNGDIIGCCSRTCNQSGSFTGKSRTS